MRSMKKLGTAAVAASAMMALFGAGSASAANFDPANTNVAAHGTLTLDGNSGVQVTCTFTAFIRSSGNDHASTVNSAGDPAGPTFDSCTSSLGPSATAVATSGTAGAWTLTATSTTQVDVTNGNATINVGGICTISAMSVAVPNNTWNNTTHVLTPNGAVSFPISESGFCPGDTTGKMTGSISVPAGSIT